MASHTAHHEAHGHKDELKTYWGVLIALMVLLVITIVVSFFHFGNTINPIIAMTIAIIKATLVIAYFMHVRHSRHLVWVFAGAGFFFLTILIAAVLTDVESRGWSDPEGNQVTYMERLPGPFEQLMKEPDQAGMGQTPTTPGH